MVKVNAYLIPISLAVPVLLQVLNISLTFGVGSAGCERSFSCLCGIKTKLRSTMSEAIWQHCRLLETRQKTHIETHAGQSSRFSMKLVYENFFEALARLKGLWSMHENYRHEVVNRGLLWVLRFILGFQYVYLFHEPTHGLDK